MNYGLLVVIAVFISMIAAFIVDIHIVFASSYEKSQTISQTTDCGNYWFPLNVLCSNVGSQAQGDENSVAIATGQAEGKVESSENFTPFP
ncbi:MAG: hypothetical protein WBX01_16800 [Nitrososphaeraceae archaeon]